MLASGIAAYLHTLGIVSYNASGVGGNTFINVVPPLPDEVVTITPYGGPEPQSKLGYDNPHLQFRSRSDRDPRPGFNRLKSIQNALHGLHGVTLPNDIYIVGAWAMQSDPAFMGVDQNGRHEYVLNVRFHIRGDTTQRE